MTLILLIDILYFRLDGYIDFTLKMESISAALIGYQLCALHVQGAGMTVIKKTQSLLLGSSLVHIQIGPSSLWCWLSSYM